MREIRALELPFGGGNEPRLWSPRARATRDGGLRIEGPRENHPTGGVLYWGIPRLTP